MVEQTNNEVTTVDMSEPMAVSALGMPKTFTPEQDYWWVMIRDIWMPVTLTANAAIGGIVMPGRIACMSEIQAIGPGVE